ncbi:MAG TPA: hypothetical protein VKA84_09695 [Gemmatimonadaceae bacterium]|nr:hypothetical protein [Gemmatimonadaceae bacterium]
MLLDREVELPWAAELGGGRSGQENGSKSRPRRVPSWPLVETDRASGPQRGGMEAGLSVTDEIVLEFDADVDEEEGDEGGDDYEDDWDDFDGLDECGPIVELGTL